MIFNRRLGTASDDSDQPESNQRAEYRVFKQHMYGGPMGLGDPTYRSLIAQYKLILVSHWSIYSRELSKMEEDPLIPQRMRDITRTQLCRPEVRAFAECSKEAGFSMVMRCQVE